MSDKLHYGIASKAWQFVAGCSPNQPCAPGCWARRTVARIADCQAGAEIFGPSRNRASFFRQALTPDLQRWSGKVVLDEAHLMDPLHWRKPALIASGFHGDWGLLSDGGKARAMAMMAVCYRHQFMTLTKFPARILDWMPRQLGMAASLLDAHAEEFLGEYGALARWPLPNVLLGCSLMTQADADAALPHMRALAEAGWKTHVWREPQIGPIDMRGWEFIECQIIGGESGAQARPFNVQWARDGIAWGRAAGVKTFVKQLGARPCNSSGSAYNPVVDRKGADPAEWPADLRVRELPEGWRV